MKLVLTGQNIEEILRSTEQQLSVERLCTIGEHTWQFATAEVEGKIHRIEFPLGLELVLHQYVLTEPLTVTTDYTLDRVGDSLPSAQRRQSLIDLAIDAIDDLSDFELSQTCITNFIDIYFQ